MDYSIDKSLVANKYIHLLAVILIIFALSPYYESIQQHRIPLVTPVFILTLIFILRVLRVGRKVFIAASIMGVCIFVLQVAADLLNGSHLWDPLTAMLCLMFAVFLLVCIALMARSLFRSSEVNVDAIVGGIDIYLLLGYFWTFLYYFIYILDGNAFHLTSAPSVTYFLYFSFSTLTTIGYGDMFPLNKWAMIIACAQGIAGQLFIAVFIARLVGLSIIAQAKRARNDLS